MNIMKLRDVAHMMCLCNSVMIPSVHMTSIASVHPGEGSSCCSPEGFFLIPCEVKGQGCCTCTDCNLLF